MNPDQAIPSECFIAGIEVKGLWGYRDVALPFTREANILIGRNATGKTSIINILRHLLSLNLDALLDITFDEATIQLKAYDGGTEHRLRATIAGDILKVSLDEESYDLELPAHMRSSAFPDSPVFDRGRSYRRRQESALRNSALRERLSKMVPSVWLPVNRGIALREDDTVYRNDPVTKVATAEDRLELLLGELKSYRLALEAKLSASYKEFEKKVLSLILYNKKYDNITSLKFETAATGEERNQLFTAFFEARLLDEEMRHRIMDHFAAQEEVLNRMAKQSGDASRKGIDIRDIFIMPLIRRTKEMIRFARDIEAEKKQIFSSLHKFTNIASEFLVDKKITVTDSAGLCIEFANPRARNLTHQHLSSGEKQILILLTQALIFEGKSVVYVADEPELSLHVTWQEKLLGALVDLNPKMQMIIATHSPDIVGKRPVIDLEKYLK